MANSDPYSGYIGGGQKLVGGILRIFLPRDSADPIAEGLGDIGRSAVQTASGSGGTPGPTQNVQVFTDVKRS